LEQLDRDELKQVVERGLQQLSANIEDDALGALLEVARGDARVALNGLEAAAALAGERAITLENVENAMQQRHLLYDRAGDQHYDIVSALIKSVRGSDPDAAVYWMARMLEAGEDVMFVARRLVILAAEDVGLADPQALSVAVAAQQAAHFVGMPEAVRPSTEAGRDLGLAGHRARLEGGIARVVSTACILDRKSLRLPAGPAVLSVARRLHDRASGAGRPRHRIRGITHADALRPG